MLFSIIIPVHNESGAIKQILEKIGPLAIDKEIVVVDDSSTDGTDKVLRELKLSNLKLIHHTSKRGKGASFLTGLANSTGEYVIFQDSDSGYDKPEDYLKLLEPVKNNLADISFGESLNQNRHGLSILWLENKLLTWIFNLFCGSNLSNYASCCKLAKRQSFLDLNLNANVFDFDIEIFCKTLKKKLRTIQVTADLNNKELVN